MKMNYLKKNMQNIIFLIIGLCLGLFIMSFNIKEEIVPLQDGNLPIITLNDKTITSNDYYEKLKTDSGITTLLDLIDEKLLNEKYTLNEEELSTVKDKMQETISFYTQYYNIDENEFLNSNGFKNKDTFLNYFILEEKRVKYEKEYLKEKITNNEVNNYYINKMNSDFEIMYIKGKSEILTEILTKLKEGATYEAIIKSYKNITYHNYSYVSFDDKEINSDIYSDAEPLEENSYTTSIRSIDDEYYIIFKGKVKEKDDVKNLKERIIKVIVEEKINNDEDNLLLKEALIQLRKENNITFHDTYLENLYKVYQK